VSNVTPIGTKRIFSLEEAQELPPLVRRITEDAVQRARDLASDAGQRSEMELREILIAWGKKVEKLGAEPKGLWLVDFDNGEGYYCWRYPETRVDHFHEYKTGFQSRQKID
jgi:hypothetical protein